MFKKIFLLLNCLYLSYNSFGQELQIFESMGFSRYSPQLQKVQKNGLQYYYHLESNVLIDKIENHAADLFVVVKDGFYGVLKEDGKLVVPFEYDEIKLAVEYKGQWYEGIPYDYKYIILKKNGRYGISDENGNIIVEPKFKQLKIINKNIIGFVDNNLWGWLHAKDGSLLQAPLFDEIRSSLLGNNFVQVRKNDQENLARIDGSLVFKMENRSYLRYIFTKSQTYFQNAKEGKTTLYDSLGNSIISIDNATLQTLRNSDFILFKRNNLFGLIDPVSGKEILSPEFTSISEDVRGLFKLKKSDMFGVADLKGKLLIPTEYDKINFVDAIGRVKHTEAVIVETIKNEERNSSLSEEQKASILYEEKAGKLPYYIQVSQGGNRSIYDWEGNRLIEPDQYQSIEPYYHKNNYFLATVNGKLSILDGQGKERLPAQYARDNTYKYNTSAIKENFDHFKRYLSFKTVSQKDPHQSEIGLFDFEQAEVILAPADQYVEWLSNQYFKVSRRLENHKKELSLYDLNGKRIFRFDNEVEDIHLLSGQLLLLKYRQAYKISNLKGEIIYENPNWTTRGSYHLIRFPEYRELQKGDFYQGLKKIYANEGNLFIDKEGWEKRFENYDQVDDFYTGYALAAKKVKDEDSYFGFKYKYGLIDVEGKTVIPFELEEISIFRNDPNLLFVKKEGKYGVLDRKGKYLIVPIYDNIESSSSYPNTIITKDGKSGLADQEGNILIAPHFEKIHRNYKGEEKTWPLMVQEGDWYYFINKEGKRYSVKTKNRTY